MQSNFQKYHFTIIEITILMIKIDIIISINDNL